MKNIVVIPARFGSSRLPGKPLAQIKGHSLLYRVWMLAKNAKNIDEVFIATDDKRVKDHAQSFGAQVIMTDSNYPTGTDRVYGAIEQLSEKPEIIINLQGDAVLTPPWFIQSLIDGFVNDSSVKMATLATHLSWEKYDDLIKSKISSKASGTTVTFDKNNDALYFSKAVIPFVRNRDESNLLNKNSLMSPVFKHVGMYGYRYDALKEFVSLPQTPLEKTESLEQLRMLENGIKIRVVVVDAKNRTMWSVDSPEDVKKVEEIIEREGELVVL
jgi:3-deoxy-manno-octulosonate cytidylyltransferase (CMP-KDO synthetase)